LRANNDLQRLESEIASYSDEPAVGRWRLLSIAVAAQAGVAILAQGLAGLAPALQHRFGLTLGQTGALLTLGPLGVGSTLFAWGWLADRRSERVVVASGLIAGGVVVLAMSRSTSLMSFAVLLYLAAALAASANAGGGRAVMGWFGPAERATALGLRQRATPVGAAAAVALTPALLAAGGLDLAMLVLGGYIVLAGIVAALALRSPPEPAVAAPVQHRVSLLRDRRMRRLSLGGAMLSIVQISWVTYTILFLTTRQGMSLGTAAALLVAMQVGGAAARVGCGRWSDRSGQRIAPQRRIALAIAAGALATAASADAPVAVSAVVVVVTGVAAICWNGLGLTAAGEIAGSQQAGAAMGLYITVLLLGATVGPLLFGLCLELSWPAAFAAAALPPLIAWRVLAPLDDSVPQKNILRNVGHMW
jgi:sugar phosphate permease